MTTIPDARWGNPDGVFARIFARIGSTKLGSRAFRPLVPLDLKVMVRTNGRRTLLGPAGAPTILLQTTGRKSGQPRISPLLFARDGNAILVAGSNFGQSHHPAWTANLIAHPEATVVAAGQRIPVSAALLAGEEAASAYRSMIEVTPVYAAYRERTDRAIRVFRLTPIEGD